MLKARLDADVKVYGDSVARLILASDDASKKASDDASKKAYARAKLARRAFKSAKKLLNQHIAEHHCEPTNPASSSPAEESPTAQPSPESRS